MMCVCGRKVVAGCLCVRAVGWGGAGVRIVELGLAEVGRLL